MVNKTTTKSIIVSDIGEAPSQNAINNYIKLDKKLNSWLQPRLCCPDVVEVTLDVFTCCANKTCGKIVEVITDETTAICLQCNTSMKLSALVYFIVIYHLKNKDII